VELSNSQSPEVIWNGPSFGRRHGGNPSSSGEDALGGTRAQKFELLKPKESKSRREYEPSYSEGHPSKSHDIKRNMRMEC
jgi:hypothetical protein